MTQGTYSAPAAHATMEDKDNGKSKESRQPFPCKVYDMLEDAASQGFEDIVSWNAAGNGFMVYHKDKFTKEIIPLYFNQTKYKSFQRQLSLYGFERITVGKNKGLRHHEKLQRGSRQLCRSMKPIGYKPRGLEQKEKVNKKVAQKPVIGDVSASNQNGTTSQLMPTASNIPIVISSNSLQQDVSFQDIPRITPDSSPLKVAEVSSDESSTSSEDMGFFEGMSFYLMDPNTDQATQALPPPVQPLAYDLALPGPADAFPRQVTEEIPNIPTIPDDGQLKKAWEIGFAVAMSMDTPAVSPPLEPASWNFLDMPTVGI